MSFILSGLLTHDCTWYGSSGRTPPSLFWPFISSGFTRRIARLVYVLREYWDYASLAAFGSAPPQSPLWRRTERQGRSPTYLGMDANIWSSRWRCCFFWWVGILLARGVPNYRSNGRAPQRQHRFGPRPQTVGSKGDILVFDCKSAFGSEPFSCFSSPIESRAVETNDKVSRYPRARVFATG